jgi:glycogen synthase
MQEQPQFHRSGAAAPSGGVREAIRDYYAPFLVTARGALVTRALSALRTDVDALAALAVSEDASRAFRDVKGGVEGVLVACMGHYAPRPRGTAVRLLNALYDGTDWQLDAPFAAEATAVAFAANGNGAGGDRLTIEGHVCVGGGAGGESTGDDSAEEENALAARDAARGFRVLVCGARYDRATATTGADYVVTMHTPHVQTDWAWVPVAATAPAPPHSDHTSPALSPSHQQSPSGQGQSGQGQAPAAAGVQYVRRRVRTLRLSLAPFTRCGFFDWRVVRITPDGQFAPAAAVKPLSRQETQAFVSAGLLPPDALVGGGSSALSPTAAGTSQGDSGPFLLPVHAAASSSSESQAVVTAPATVAAAASAASPRGVLSVASCGLLQGRCVVHRAGLLEEQFHEAIVDLEGMRFGEGGDIVKHGTFEDVTAQLRTLRAGGVTSLFVLGALERDNGWGEKEEAADAAAAAVASAAAPAARSARPPPAPPVHDTESRAESESGFGFFDGLAHLTATAGGGQGAATGGGAFGPVALSLPLNVAAAARQPPLPPVADHDASVEAAAPPAGMRSFAARPDANPHAVVDRVTPNRMLGGAAGFFHLVSEARSLGVRILVQCDAAVSASRPHRKYKAFYAHTLDGKGQAVSHAGTDSVENQWEDTQLLNYRKLEAWELLVSEAKHLALSLGVGGLYLTDAQSYPFVQALDTGELFRRDVDGEGHYTPREILEGEVVVANTEVGYWSTKAAQTFPNPLLVKLVRALWAVAPDFTVTGESHWGRSPALVRSGIVPNTLDVIGALASTVGRYTDKNGHVTSATLPRDVAPVAYLRALLAGEADGVVPVQAAPQFAARFLHGGNGPSFPNPLTNLLPSPAGPMPANGQILQLRSLASARMPYPALLLGRSNWTAVDLLYTLPGVPMTFQEEKAGRAYRVDVTGTYAYNAAYLEEERKKREKRLVAEKHVSKYRELLNQQHQLQHQLQTQHTQAGSGSQQGSRMARLSEATAQANAFATAANARALSHPAEHSSPHLSALSTRGPIIDDFEGHVGIGGVVPATRPVGTPAFKMARTGFSHVDLASLDAAGQSTPPSTGDAYWRSLTDGQDDLSIRAGHVPHMPTLFEGSPRTEAASASASPMAAVTNSTSIAAAASAAAAAGVSSVASTLVGVGGRSLALPPSASNISLSGLAGQMLLADRAASPEQDSEDANLEDEDADVFLTNRKRKAAAAAAAASATRSSAASTLSGLGMTGTVVSSRDGRLSAYQSGGPGQGGESDMTRVQSWAALDAMTFKGEGGNLRDNVRQFATLEARHKAEVGPEYGFNLSQIFSHYDHRRVLRQRYPVLRIGQTAVLTARHRFGEHGNVFAFVRHMPNQIALVATNFNGHSSTFGVDCTPLVGAFGASTTADASASVAHLMSTSLGVGEAIAKFVGCASGSLGVLPSLSLRGGVWEVRDIFRSEGHFSGSARFDGVHFTEEDGPLVGIMTSEEAAYAPFMATLEPHRSFCWLFCAAAGNSGPLALSQDKGAEADPAAMQWLFASSLLRLQSIIRLKEVGLSSSIVTKTEVEAAGGYDKFLHTRNAAGKERWIAPGEALKDEEIQTSARHNLVYSLVRHVVKKAWRALLLARKDGADIGALLAASVTSSGAAGAVTDPLQPLQDPQAARARVRDIIEDAGSMIEAALRVLVTHWQLRDATNSEYSPSESEAPRLAALPLPCLHGALNRVGSVSPTASPSKDPLWYCIDGESAAAVCRSALFLAVKDVVAQTATTGPRRASDAPANAANASAASTIAQAAGLPASADITEDDAILSAVLLKALGRVARGATTAGNSAACHSHAGVTDEAAVRTCARLQAVEQGVVAFSKRILWSNSISPVVFVTPELGKWSTVGGLGVMVDELSVGLAELGAEVICISPYYNLNRKGVADYLKADNILYSGRTVTVSVGGERIEMGVHEGRVHDVRLFFLHHAFVFPKPYPSLDAYQQVRVLSAFAKACLELLCQWRLIPSLVVTNDWFTGLVPAYARHGHFGDVFNSTDFMHIAHNLDPDYEGRLWPDPSQGTLQYLHELPPHLLVDPHWDKIVVNPTRAALLSSDTWATVSRSYRQDLLNSSPLRSLLRLSAQPFAHPNGIPVKARVARLAQLPAKTHEEAKSMLQKKYFGFEQVDLSLPLFAFVGRITMQKGVHLILQTVEDILRATNGRAMFLVGGMASQTDTYGQGCSHAMRELRARYPSRFWADPTLFFVDGDLVNLGADFCLMPSMFEPGGIVQQEFFVAGTPVIAFKTGGLKDTVIEYDPQSGRGNGITFEGYAAPDFVMAVRRAITFFSDPALYRRLRASARASVMDLAVVSLGWFREFHRIRRCLPVPPKKIHNGAAATSITLKLTDIPAGVVAPTPSSQVFLTGSFSSWTERQPLIYVPATGQFECRLTLAPGLYQCKFIVDGIWTSSNAMPSATDSAGIVNNLIQVNANHSVFDNGDDI